MTLKCPLCGSDDVRYDSRMDEYYCGNCGYVFSKGEIDIGIYVQGTSVPLGSVFNGKDEKYRKLSAINNKNDINTYRILQLQKIKSFVATHGLPMDIYDWVVHIMKERVNERWRFSYMVAVLYLGVIKYGFYRSIEEFEEYFGIDKKILWKQIYKASQDLGIDYVIDGERLARIFAKEYNDYCVNCCIDYITSNVGKLAIRYGASPRIFALTYVFLCKLHCDGDIIVSKFMKINKIPRNSLNQNVIRILKEFGINVGDNTSLKKDDIKKYVEVMMNGSDCKSSKVD